MRPTAAIRVTFFCPLRQTQWCVRCFRWNPKCESHPPGSTLGFRHSQWPDVSPGTQAQRRKRRERPSLRWGLISNYSRRATGSTRATGPLAVISSSRLIFVFSVSWTSRLFSDVKLLTACHRSFHTGWSFLCARVIVCPRAVVPMRRLDRGSS